MTRTRPRGEPSQRQLRVSEVLRKALSEVLLRTEIDDPDLYGLSITVSEVQVSPDLRNATAFVLPLGGDSEARTVAALIRHRRFLRGEVARRVTLRYMPALSFRLDESFDRSERLAALLRSPDVARDLD